MVCIYKMCIINWELGDYSVDKGVAGILIDSIG